MTSIPPTSPLASAAGAAEIVPPDQDSDVPLIWRTTDGGKTWTSIVNGLPSDERTGSWVNSLRVDPEAARPALRRHRDHRLRQLR